MIEVEIKLPVPEADAVKEKLLNLGFREERWIQEHDVYFDDSRNSIRTRGEAPAGAGNQGLPYRTGQRADEL